MVATAGPADERPRWLSITGAALWVSLSAKTIRRKIATGELRAYRCGKTIRARCYFLTESFTFSPACFSFDFDC